MTSNVPKKIEASNEVEEDDDFDLGSDDEGNTAKIAVPVAHFQSKFVLGKDEQSGKSLQKDDLLSLDEDSKSIITYFLNVELQEILANPEEKEKLIRKLLEREMKERPAKKNPASATKEAEKEEAEYEGKHDPQNPENETDFKKAYNKVSVPSSHNLIASWSDCRTIR